MWLIWIQLGVRLQLIKIIWSKIFIVWRKTIILSFLDVCWLKNTAEGSLKLADYFAIQNVISGDIFTSTWSYAKHAGFVFAYIEDTIVHC